MTQSNMEQNSSARAQLIRDGNRAFNEKDYKKAKELFIQAGYHDGLVRLGDYYMYERRLPLLAYGYYKKAGATEKIKDIQRRMVGALGDWIGRDKLKNDPAKVAMLETDREGFVGVPVSPLLKQTALKILEKSSSSL